MRLTMADPLACARGLSTRRAQDGSATAELALFLCRTRRAGFELWQQPPPEDAPVDVRFCGYSGYHTDIRQRLLLTQSGHWRAGAT